MALQYGIVKPENQKMVLDRLIHDITINRENHFYGGIFTGHALWELMPQTGNAKLAFDVAKNDTYPGFGFMLKNGATSVWEHWEDQASHIHHFMGFVDNYLIRHVAGINSNMDHPGFGVIDVEPKFIDGIYHAEASYNSVHGLINVDWVKEIKGNYTLRVKVPVNCKANVILPEMAKEISVNGMKPKSDRIRTIRMQDQIPKKSLLIPSGSYQIKFEI